MPIKDALEVFIKIFHGEGTEFVKDASHLDFGVALARIRG